MQFIEAGCDNCRFLRMEDDRDAVTNLTTPNFTGWVAVRLFSDAERCFPVGAARMPGGMDEAA